MAHLTENEKKALLILFKDFSSYYNANSLSKKIGISRVGAMKLLKKLENKKILAVQRIGKSLVYKINWRYDYAQDLISFVLSDEAIHFERWKDEFKGLFKNDRIVMLHGSVLSDYNKARDIDLMVIREKGESGEINKAIRERQGFLPKKIHLIDLSKEEFLKNVKNKQEAITDIVKKSVVLYGQKIYVVLIKNVSGF